MRTQLGVLALLLGLPVAGVAQQKITLPAQDNLLRERPTQIFQIGAEDGEEWELLSGVRQVVFDKSDNLFVLDGNNTRILMFDPNGRFVRQVGKKGGGPGELMSPVGVTINNDGNLVVSDVGRRGFSLFKPDGTFIRNVVWEEGQLLGMGGIQAHPRGGVVGRGAAFGMAFGGGGGRGREGGGREGISVPTGRSMTAAAPLKIHWTDLATGKTSELFQVEQPPVPQQVERSGSGNQQNVRVMIQQPEFMPQISFAVTPDGGLAVSHEADYRVKMVDANGRITRVIERPIAPRKATQKDKEMALQRRRERMTSGDGAVMIRVGDGGGTSVQTGTRPAGENIPSIDEMMRTTTFLDVIPVLRGVDVDVFGRLWIRRTPADLGLKGPIDLVSPDGRYIGTIPNDRAPAAVSRSGRAAYIERDDLNVEHVVVRKLPASWMVRGS